jgi:ribosomal protein L16 Arg81 hydroxylase
LSVVSPQIGLEDLFLPESSEDFLATVWGKRFHVVKGASGRFKSLFTWDALNDVLEQHRLAFPRLRLAREGKSIPFEQYSRELPLRRGGHKTELLPLGFIEALQSGSTIVLDAVDELYRPLTLLAESLEYSLRERVQINAYVGFGEARGFDLHWDDHDVLVLQLEGRKHWQVFGQTRPHPLYRDVEQSAPPTGDPLWDGFLESGDVLYIPRGWWHVAVPLAEPTFHLTCGITKRTGMDLLAWLVERGRRAEACRRDVPRFESDAELLAYGHQILQQVLPQEGENFVRTFLAEQDARAEARPKFKLPRALKSEILTGADTVTLIAPRPIELEIQGDAVSFRALGKDWEFALQAQALIQTLVTRRRTTISELIAESGLTDDDGFALIRELGIAGLVVFDA